MPRFVKQQSGQNNIGVFNIKIKKYAGYFIYNLFAKHLPVSNSKIKMGQKRLRAFCGKLMLENCGKKVNIEKNADFSTRVSLGDDVWIGGNVTILPGVKIGSHSIIGACSVVTKDVPEYAIVAGNPAQIKKFRK